MDTEAGDGEYKVKFTPPETYPIPDDKRPGDTFEATATLRVESDGKLCLVSLDGVPMDEEGETKEETPEMEQEEQMPKMSLADAVKAQRAGNYQM